MNCTRLHEQHEQNARNDDHAHVTVFVSSSPGCFMDCVQDSRRWIQSSGRASSYSTWRCAARRLVLNAPLFPDRPPLMLWEKAAVVLGAVLGQV
eukprot:753523-Hanusia_phi.AAC.6